MGNVIFKRCCTGTPEGVIRDGKYFLHCPNCGKEMYLFPTGATRKIAEAAAKRWNESLLVKEEADGR